MIGAILWGIGASMALAEEEAKAKSRSKDEQLEEAKEIIRECMGQMAFHDCEYTDAYKKAEAFLKETEK